MKRNKITSSEVMDVMESTSDLIKLPKEVQYLKHTACNAVTAHIFVTSRFTAIFKWLCLEPIVQLVENKKKQIKMFYTLMVSTNFQSDNKGDVSLYLDCYVFI